MDASTLSRCRVTQAEFATLIGVSRVTVNLWMRGKMKPSKKLEGKVTLALAALDFAFANDALPLKGIAKGAKMAQLAVLLEDVFAVSEDAAA